MKNKGRRTTFEIESFDRKVTLLRWYDNKIVNIGSNFMSSGTPENTYRYNKKTKTREEVEVPEIIKTYNANMGGVDTFNQCLSYYRTFLKSKKWTLRMISHGIDIAIVNSWYEYVRDTEKLKIPKSKRLDLLKFRSSIANDLVHVGRNVFTNKKRGRPSQDSLTVDDSPQPKRRNTEVRPSNNSRLDSLDHLPEFDNKKEATRCKFKNCKGRTHIFCLKCNVHMCFVKERNCFIKFHTI